MLNMSQINDIREAYAIVGKVAPVARVLVPTDCISVLTELPVRR